MSVPRTAAVRSPLHAVIQQRSQTGSPRRGDVTLSTARLVDEPVQAINTARAEYEERELAADAVPLCSSPDDIIEGEHGLPNITLIDWNGFRQKTNLVYLETSVLPEYIAPRPVSLAHTSSGSSAT